MTRDRVTRELSPDGVVLFGGRGVVSRIRTSHAPDGWRDVGPATPARNPGAVVALQVGEMQPFRHVPPRKKPKVEA